MPALMIEPQPDGTVLVAPTKEPIDPANAESFPDMNSALAAAAEVLEGPGVAEGEEDPAHEAGEPQPEAPAMGGDTPMPAAQAPGQDETEAAMEAGYTKAKKGR